jgi:hypothetical protein
LLAGLRLSTAEMVYGGAVAVAVFGVALGADLNWRQVKQPEVRPAASCQNPPTRMTAADDAEWAVNPPVDLMQRMRASMGKHPGVGARIIYQRGWDALLCVGTPIGD